MYGTRHLASEATLGIMGGRQDRKVGFRACPGLKEQSRGDLKISI